MRMHHAALQIPEYIQIVGIICGMITIGYLGDRIGRKWGSVTTVSLMCIGAILLTVQNGTTDKGQVGDPAYRMYVYALMHSSLRYAP